jgi:organic radical activating enzyme
VESGPKHVSIAIKRRPGDFLAIANPGVKTIFQKKTGIPNSMRWGSPLRPEWIELSFSNLCNFSCLYCNSKYSSSWEKEDKKFGPWEPEIAQSPTGPVKVDKLRLDNFKKWLEPLLPNLKKLKITGGEPLLHYETIELLQFLNEHKAPRLKLEINTNLNPPEKHWEPFVKVIGELSASDQYKRISVNPSLEAWGRQAEFIRYGLDLEKFQGNLRNLLEQTQTHIKFHSAINALSPGSLQSFWEYVLKLKKTYNSSKRGVSISSFPVQQPQWLSVASMGTRQRNQMVKLIQYATDNLDPQSGFTNIEVMEIKNIEAMLAGKTQIKKETANVFMQRMQDLEIRRNIRFQSDFPELYKEMEARINE